MRLCQYLRPKIHPLLLDATINSPQTVRLNIYQVRLPAPVGCLACLGPGLLAGGCIPPCCSAGATRCLSQKHASRLIDPPTSFWLHYVSAGLPARGYEVSLLCQSPASCTCGGVRRVVGSRACRWVRGWLCHWQLGGVWLRLAGGETRS